eukprot:403353670
MSLFVGNISKNVRKSDLVDDFEKYGKCDINHKRLYILLSYLGGDADGSPLQAPYQNESISQCTYKAAIQSSYYTTNLSLTSPPSLPIIKVVVCLLLLVSQGNYAFIEFDNERDAEEAVDELQGKDMGGLKINIEWSKKSGRFNAKDSKRPQRSERSRDDLKCYNCNKTGHFARDCRARRRSRSRSGDRRRGGRDDRRDRDRRRSSRSRSSSRGRRDDYRSSRRSGGDRDRERDRGTRRSRSNDSRKRRGSSSRSDNRRRGGNRNASNSPRNTRKESPVRNRSPSHSPRNKSPERDNGNIDN